MAAYLIGEIDMITCKEDLFNTWIKNDNGELCELYLELCTNHGIFRMGSGTAGTVDSFSGMNNVGVCAGDESITCSDFWDYSANGCKQLTIDDLKREGKQEKPKPTKFVRVEESIFDLKEEFENGELYVSTCEGHYTQILGDKGLFLAAFNNSIYRQVEVDWGSELREALELTSHRPLGTGSVRVGDSDLTDDEFISLCHKVAELTDKPE